MLRAGESRDDEHWGTAVWAHECGSYAVGPGGGRGEIGGQLRWTYAANDSRVCSVISNCTGRWVFCCITIVRDATTFP